MGQSRPLFVYFHTFHITISIIQIEKSVDGVLGTRTQDCRMVGADETTELWRPPNVTYLRACMRLTTVTIVSIFSLKQVKCVIQVSLNCGFSNCHLHWRYISIHCRYIISYIKLSISVLKINEISRNDHTLKK